MTIPIGAWTASLVFDLIGIFVDDPTPYVVGARVLIVVGLVGAVLAAVWGFLDYLQLERGTPAQRTGLVHMLLNLAAMALFAVNLIVRFAGDDDDVSVAGLILTIVALLALSLSGWLGGKLAYTYGVRVADEQKQTEGFRPSP
ncbi:DUF2231 domain-containing protein [Microbacterium sp. ET2]|uniref:DUF2231 domain-containing protein n=1 Tax=Microbacterium albipurpureum TaxID=3050384 RepID=UPI00259C7E69|nr:DUF2231 domain-containing protein [Microbacterium sp. ET2 (Ac-2212)]WJL95357.1 DUF2231 domain-containing protein [Microbacterium sp. ET2 (Ac-2212)]